MIDGENSIWKVRLMTTVTAVSLSMCSLLFSISFGITLGENFLISTIFATMLATIAVAEFLSANFLIFALKERNTVIIFAALWLMLGGMAISIIAGQSALQQAVSETRDVNKRESDTYRHLQNRIDIMQKEYDSLFISDNAIKEAKKGADNARIAIKKLLAAPATNSRGRNAGLVSTRVGDCQRSGYYISKYCPSIIEKKRELNGYLAVIEQGNTLKEKQSQILSLKDTMMVSGSKSISGEIPGILALSNVLSVSPEKLSNSVFLFLAIFCEVSAMLLWGIRASLIKKESGEEVEAITRSFVVTESRPPTSYQSTPAISKHRSNQQHLTCENDWNDVSSDVYKHATKALNEKMISPTAYSIKKWGNQNGIKFTRAMVTKLQQRWMDAGLVQKKVIRGVNSFSVI